jgi:outer membrane protein assembly factor BamD
MRVLPHSSAARRAGSALALAFGLCALAALGLGLSGCGSANRPVAAATPQDQLRLAQLRYDRREYLEAIELAKGYIQFRAGASDLDEAHFLLGMCYVQRKEWPLAAGEFLIVASEFSDSPRAGDAHYWLGTSYWKQARGPQFDQDYTRRAIAQWDRFLQLYPDHPKAEEARAVRLEGRARLAEKALRNGNLYVTLKHWDPARYYFNLVLHDYSDTKWVDAARVGIAATYRGTGQFAEARAVLEDALPAMTDPEAKHKAEELLKKLPPAPPPPPAASDSTGASGTTEQPG